MASSANINKNNGKKTSTRDVRENPSVAKQTPSVLKKPEKNKTALKQNKEVLLDKDLKVAKNEGALTTISITSRNPWDEDDDDHFGEDDTPDSQMGLSMAFDGGYRQPTSNGFKRRKKKLIKKKSDKRTSSNLLSSPQTSHHQHSQPDNKASVIPNEFAVNKLERIYKPEPGNKVTTNSSHEDELNVRVMSKQNVDSSDEENEPSLTGYYIRTLDPSHNKFEMTSQGVQTDWSWLRDNSNLDNEKVDSANIEDVKERLKFGLYGGFGPANPGKSYFLHTFFITKIIIQL